MPIQLSSRFNRMAEGIATIVLQVEMKKRNIKYEELLEMINLLGANENLKNLRNKIGRGTFSAGFFLMCLVAMGADQVKIDFDRKLMAEIENE